MVERVEVRLEKGWAEVFVRRDAPPEEEALREAVEGAGYSVAGID